MASSAMRGAGRACGRWSGLGVGVSGTTSPPWRSGRVWRALCAQVYQEESICWICLQPVDVTLRGRTRWSRSVDHVKPVDSHPHLALLRSNLRLAHYGCNSRRQATAAVPYEPSRVW